MRCFYYALSGFYAVFWRERNMRIHTAAAFYVVLGGLVCRIHPLEWCAALLCIALCLGLECINTAIESACDAVTEAYSEKIALAKDAAAAAVLMAAVFSSIVGGVIFFRAEHIQSVINFATEYPIGAAAIVLTVPLWIKLIAMRRTKPCHKSQNRQ